MNALGRQVLAEYYKCDPEILNDVMRIEEAMLAAAKAAEATVINSTFHHFSPYGVSGVVVIQESHLAIHTWPEYGYAAVDVFTCGGAVDPWVAYGFLKAAFGAEYASAMEMLRGQAGEVQKTDFRLRPVPVKAVPQKIVSNRSLWFTERDDSVALSLRHKGDRLFAGQSDFQKVEVFDTYAYGRLLALDGKVMTSEEDEYVYHEMIVHVPMQVIRKARRVLIIGGGDGGAAREVLRYPDVDTVVMVEIDGMVVEAAQEFLPGIGTAFDDTRLDLRIEDGIAFVKNVPDTAFDLVIVDSTDPGGQGEGLFTKDFYRHVHRILSQGGIMVSQSGSPRYNSEVFQRGYARYRAIFGSTQVHCYLSHIPTYPTGMGSMYFCTKSGVHPLRDLDSKAADTFSTKEGLRYYNADIHRSAFALPNFVRDLLQPNLVHD